MSMVVCQDCQQSTSGYCWRHANAQHINFRPDRLWGHRPPKPPLEPVIVVARGEIRIIGAALLADGRYRLVREDQ